MQNSDDSSKTECAATVAAAAAAKPKREKTAPVEFVLSKPPRFSTKPLICQSGIYITDSDEAYHSLLTGSYWGLHVDACVKSSANKSQKVVEFSPKIRFCDVIRPIQFVAISDAVRLFNDDLNNEVLFQWDTAQSCEGVLAGAGPDSKLDSSMIPKIIEFIVDFCCSSHRSMRNMKLDDSLPAECRHYDYIQSEKVLVSHYRTAAGTLEEIQTYLDGVADSTLPVITLKKIELIYDVREGVSRAKVHLDFRMQNKFSLKTWGSVVYKNSKQIAGQVRSGEKTSSEMVVETECEKSETLSAPSEEEADGAECQDSKKRKHDWTAPSE